MEGCGIDPVGFSVSPFPMALTFYILHSTIYVDKLEY
jgi:hypothetical protein